jgi:predicted SAM-dependent methyltransferase
MGGIVLGEAMSTQQAERTDVEKIEEYLRQHAIKKLQIGSGINILKGWLNSDLHASRNTVSVDATKTFPFEGDVFHYVYSEHMIEHIDFTEGLHMLSECYRVLKPGGKIRIATPDLAFLIDLYRADKSPLQEEYIRWSIDTFAEHAPGYEDTYVINSFVRSWGHQFIYDEKVLRASLEKTCFTDVRPCEVRESTDEHLRGLENESRMPAGFLRLETFVMEATKPNVRDGGETKVGPPANGF